MAANGANLSRMDAFYNFIDPWLGLGTEPKDLTFLQISLRGIIVVLATLAMIRIGHKRSLARKTAFDAVLIVILASVLSRAINGSSAFFATIGGLNDSHLARRTFAATTTSNRALLGVCSEVSLAELSKILATTSLAEDLKVERALNLDGGSSSAFWFARENGSAFSIPERKPVRDFVGIIAK